MHESTLFNIITNIQFFKYFLIGIKLNGLLTNIFKEKYSMSGSLIQDTESSAKLDKD